MADTPDDLLAKARAGMGEWLDAEDRSDAEFEAAQRMYQGIYDLDRALSSGAPLPSAWKQAADPDADAVAVQAVRHLNAADAEIGALRIRLAGKDAGIARLTAELDATRNVPVEYVPAGGLGAAMAADPAREDGCLLRETGGERRAFAWKAATGEWERVQ